MIEIKTEKRQNNSIVHISGEIDAAAAPEVQEYVIPLSKAGANIILDLTKTEYMSSAGLRMLLSVYRQVKAAQAQISLIGVSEDIKDTMSMTGFLGFFTIYDTLEAALQ